MELGCKITAELEIETPPQKFYVVFSGKEHHHIPKNTDHIHDVHMHDGEPGSHGSHRNWTYVAAGNVEKIREKTTLDDKNRVVTLEVVDGEPLKIYKSYVGSLNIDPNPKGQGSLVKWTLVYEKLKPDVPDAFHYMEAALKITRDLDAALLKA